MLRIIRRIVFWCVLVVAVPVVLAVLGTVIPNPFVFADPAEGAPTRNILVVANTIHTDIAIPVEPQSLAALGFLAETGGQPVTHPDARWLLIGWGGRSFYMETPNLSDIKPGPTFRALTIDSSVIHVDVLAGIDERDPAIMALPVSDAEYANLLVTIAASFTRRDGVVLPIDGFAFGTVDRFYEAEGGFNALLGCNVWTSRMLRSAGATTGIWNPLPSSLMLSLDWFNP